MKSEPLFELSLLRFEGAGYTDIGRVRDSNEDSFATVPELGLFMVADGMGGHAFGEIASRMAIDVVREAFEDPDTCGEPATFGRRGLPLLRAAIQRANERIIDAGRKNTAMRGMGTTFAGVLADGARVTIAHVGDSRVYRLRGRKLERLTEDHSLLNDFIRLGMVREHDAAGQRLGHILTRALGAEEGVEVETRVEPVEDGDVLLLCSDGLTGAVSEADIRMVLASIPDPIEAAEALVERANEAGGPDNVTCVVLRWRTASSDDASGPASGVAQR